MNKYKSYFMAILRKYQIEKKKFINKKVILENSKNLNNCLNII